MDNLGLVSARLTFSYFKLYCFWALNTSPSKVWLIPVLRNHLLVSELRRNDILKSLLGSGFAQITFIRFQFWFFVGIWDRSKWKINMFSWIRRRKTIFTGLNLEKRSLHNVFWSSAFWDQPLLVFKCSFWARSNFYIRFFGGVIPFPMCICGAAACLDWLLVFSRLEQTILCFWKRFLGSRKRVYQMFHWARRCKTIFDAKVWGTTFLTKYLRFQQPASNV